MIKSLRTSLLIFLLFFPGLSLKAQHTHFQPGDIFLGQGGGIIQWRDANGVLIRNINTGDGGGNGNGTGLRIHPMSGQLWVTNSNLPPGSTNSIRIINTDGTPGNAINISAYQKAPTSITFDKQGNAYVGGLWNDQGDEIVKINPAGTVILDHFRVSSDGYVWGPEWVEMDCNDSIIYYTNLRAKVKRYNVVTHQQLPDFANLTGLPTWFFAMRLLPDSTMILVSADNRVVRLNSAGMIIKNYAPTNLCGFFVMAATPDGKSFWAGGLGPGGPMYKFDIASEMVLDSFVSAPTLPGINIHGIAVYGDALNNCPSVVPVPTVVKNINAYPNPTNGNFTLQTNLTGKLVIKVFNNLGQPVYNNEFNFADTNNKIPMHLEHLAAGIYVVQIISKDNTVSQKIVIN